MHFLNIGLHVMKTQSKLCFRLIRDIVILKEVAATNPFITTERKGWLDVTEAIFLFGW